MKKHIVLIITVVIIILIIAVAYSYIEFGVINPFKTGYSLIKIIIGNDKYVVVQEEPHRVIFSKGNAILNPKELLDEYMKENGYHEDTRSELGSDFVYTNGKNRERILYSVNSRYSKWEWE